VTVGLFINFNNDLPASFKAAGHLSRYCYRLQLEHKAAAVTQVSPHIAGWRDKHIARPHINKKK
jgi:hypothetical protein